MLSAWFCPQMRLPRIRTSISVSWYGLIHHFLFLRWVSVLANMADSAVTLVIPPTPDGAVSPTASRVK